MKKSLVVAISLALLSGCEGEKKESVPPPQVVTATATGASAADSSGAGAGERTYKGTCSICHKTGLNGAPRVGNLADWQQRLAQGKEVLYTRAINGYAGSKGSMPPRGGNLKLSADEVKAAVDFMVEQSIPVSKQ